MILIRCAHSFILKLEVVLIYWYGKQGWAEKEVKNKISFNHYISGH